ILHGQARGAGTPVEFHGDRQRGVESRRAAGSAHRDRRVAGRGRAEQRQDAGALARRPLWNASGAQLGNYPDKYNVMAAVSYVTGSHNVKVGMQDAWGPYKRWNTANADLYQLYQAGRPFQVTVLNTPLTTAEYLDANFGLYAQDSWRVNRFTINVGL